ncbi:hypothetical protein C7S16_5652 [Burkholderia thailandensis]|uniref:Uncharacterized protein n=1 Tax=Burkholderia thailandensis TaxID=57975 RepID=A0AAW9CSM1_BURTH|nr:hypothetical protein [Burkholderia thailandensis]MDW9252033.1 hypothetical protein [Burkholderia thailandensis]
MKPDAAIGCRRAAARCAAGRAARASSSKARAFYLGEHVTLR